MFPFKSKALRRFLLFLLVPSALLVLLSACMASATKRSHKLSDKAWDQLLLCEQNRANKNKIDRSTKWFDQAIRLNPNNAEAYEGMGRALCFQDQHQEAIGYFDKAIGLTLQSTSCFNARANCKKDMGLIKEAIDDYLTAKNLSPKDHIVHFNLGLLYHDEKDYDKALKSFGNAIKYNPEYLKAYYRRGCTYKMMESYDLAMTDLNYVISKDPRYTDAYHEIALVYQAQLKYKESLEPLNKALSIDKDCGYCYYTRGYAKQHMEQSQEALEDYLVYRNIYPQNTDVYTCIGLMYSRLGDKV